MEELLERYNLCLDILNQVKDQITPTDGKDDLFHLYAKNVESYAEKIQTDVLEELKRKIRYYQRTAGYSGSVSMSGQVDPRAYRLSDVCSKYGLDSDILYDYLRSGNSEGAACYIVQHTCYNEMCMYTDFFQKFQLLTVYKFATPKFPQGGTEYQRLKYASILSSVKQMADTAYDEFVQCFNEKTMGRLVESMERYIAYYFQKTQTIPQKPVPYYTGKAALIVTLVGTGIAACAGGIAGHFIGILPLPSWIISSGLVGALFGFIVGKIVQARKVSKTEALSAQIKLENKRLEEESFEKFQKKFTSSTAMTFAENKDSLIYVLRVLGDTCRQILALPEFSFLPTDYRYDAKALNEFVKYFDNKRVDSIKEAVNLYVSVMDAERRQEELKRLEEVRIAEQRRQNEILENSRKERLKTLQGIQKAVRQMYSQQKSVAEKRADELKNLRSDLHLANMQAQQTLREIEQAQFQANLQTEKLYKELEG